jgi:hypothetical protein
VVIETAEGGVVPPRRVGGRVLPMRGQAQGTDSSPGAQPWQRAASCGPLSTCTAMKAWKPLS